MTPDQWQRVQALFHDLADREPADRKALLEQVHADDSAVYDELQAMLAEDPGTWTLLDATSDHLASWLAEPMEETLPGTEIGPYRLLRELGRGGMGTVYLAERTDIQKQVALKLVRDSLASPEHVDRFLFERRVLARLEHPAIARLLDAGVTEQGTPYFAMEYVDGVPLDRYCDAYHLDVPARIRLFMAVCEAVEYAHRNLIVHRDLKPSNILVTDEGHVKLLDFGIAKLLDDSEADAPAELTRTGMRILTPGYAAPEQIRGASVTTPSDVYALGVILYELLTGHRPYHTEGKTPLELERLICESQPEPPSTAVTRVVEVQCPDGSTRSMTPDVISQERATSIERLRRQLGGDLDTIILMALRKEPGRRYPSAAHFAEDLRRHLDGLPVSARPDTAGYRLQKFMARHTAGVAVAGVFLVLALGFATFYTVRVTAERNRAQQEAEKAAQVAAFLVDLFDSSDPFSTAPLRGDTLHVRTVLNYGAAQIQTRLADQPGIQADLVDVMSRVYTNLSLYADAESLLTQALTDRINLFGSYAPETARAHYLLGLIHHEQGHFTAADSLLQLAVSVLVSEAPSSATLPDALIELGRLRQDQARFDEADSLFAEALTLRRKTVPSDHPDLAEIYNEQALLKHKQGEYEGATLLHQQAIDLRRQALGPQHPSVAQSISNLARARHQQGQYAEAARLFREALALKERLLGPQHPSIAASLNSLGQVYRDQSNYAAADSCYRAALAIWRSTFGEVHPQVAHGLTNRAALFHDQGDYNRADSLYRSILDMSRYLYGPDHPDVAVALNNLGSLHEDRGHYAEAEAYYEQSLTIRLDAYGPRHPAVATILNNLGTVRWRQERYDEAEANYQEALDLLRTLLGRDHAETVTTLNNLAVLYYSTGRRNEAAEQFTEAIAVLETIHGPRHTDVATARANLAAVQTSRERYEEAIVLYRQALDVQIDLFGTDHVRVALTQTSLAEALRRAGRYENALPLYQQALLTHRKHPETTSRSTRLTHAGLGQTLLALDRPDEAIPYLQDALRILETHPHPRYLFVTRLALGACLTRLHRFAEAEPPLLSAYEQASPDQPEWRRQARTHLANLYDAWGKMEQAVAYQND